MAWEKERRTDEVEIAWLSGGRVAGVGGGGVSEWHREAPCGEGVTTGVTVVCRLTDVPGGSQSLVT